MNLFLVFALFAIGILCIVKGGDLFVDASSWFAEISGIPKLIVGATIVSVATTLPELLTSVMAAAKGKVDMAIGNAVGSVTANVGLIMALSFLFLPAVIQRRDYLGKVALMLLASVIVVAAGFSGQVGTGVSLVLLAIFVAFLIENVSSAKRSMESDLLNDRKGWRTVGRKWIILNTAKFVVGTIGIVVGANLLVDNGSELARIFGIPERVIGVTMIAVGTSLPELITTLTAIAKKQSSLSVGNILGANIIDLALILPISALVAGKPLTILPTSAQMDLPVCLLVGCTALIPAMLFEKFQRWQGVALLAIYIAYLFFTCTGSLPIA